MRKFLTRGIFIEMLSTSHEFYKTFVPLFVVCCVTLANNGRHYRVALHHAEDRHAVDTACVVCVIFSISASYFPPSHALCFSGDTNIVTMSTNRSHDISTPRLFAQGVESQPTEFQPPPYLQRLYPDKGHIVGGTTVTIFGGGFARSPKLRVRFSHATGEVDEVTAKYLDSGRVTLITPETQVPGDYHVAVANDGAAYSSFPLVTDDEGTYLLFAYVDTTPQGAWTVDNATGSTEGGTSVVLHNDQAHTSSRFSDLNFLPGRHLRCRFGNSQNISDMFTFNFTVAAKTSQHPWFGVGHDHGYVITDERGYRGYSQGSTITVVRGKTYEFNLRNLAGCSFYFTTAEPHVWRAGAYLGEYTDTVSNGRAYSGTVTFAVGLNAPDVLYYACGEHSHVGGRINVVSLTSVSAPPETLQNAVPAEWLSYNRIRCVTPPWDGITDDDPIHGGHQVTIFVTNDGLHYSAGFGGPDETIDGGPPLNVGRGATFTYFGAEGFRDAARFYPADSDNAATVAIAGGPLVTLNPMGKDTFSYHSKLMHSYSDVYDDRGQSSASHMNASAAAAAAAEATTAALSSGGAAPRNDIIIGGEYAGDGLAWYEIVADGEGTIRWRSHHGQINSSQAWVEIFLAVTADDPTTDEIESVDLDHGLKVGFLDPSGHSIGDRWTFRVYGGNPLVTAATTKHNEPQYAARGPFEGNTEITISGNAFFPSTGLLCRLHDGVTNATMILTAHFDSMQQIRCISQRHEPLPGGEEIATIKPCLFKTIQVSHNNGRTWSTASAEIRFLFCDIYVSVDGSDVAGYGTPDRPYASLQRGIEASLSHPRSYYAPGAHADFTSREARSTSTFIRESFGVARPRVQNKGYGFCINRDRIVVGAGTFSGNGNFALHPLGKMLEIAAKVESTAVIDCGKTGMGATIPTGDRHGSESTGSISIFGIHEVGCNQRV